MPAPAESEQKKDTMTKRQFQQRIEYWKSEQIVHMPRKTDDELWNMSDSFWYEQQFLDNMTERKAFVLGSRAAIIAEMDYRRSQPMQQ